MRIIELHADNVKRLTAIDLTPAEHVQIIGGNNAAGKSSVLDAIWLALGGAAASRAITQPVRAGQDTASVRLDLGEYIVTRTWKGAKSTLVVSTPDGARHQSPQTILDGLLGSLTFDPLAFTRMNPNAQRAALLDLVAVPIDLDALEHQRETAYVARTEASRYVRSLEGALFAMGAVEASVPDQEVSAADLLAQVRSAEQHNRDRRSAEAELMEYQQTVARLEQDLRYARNALEDTKDELETMTPAIDLEPLNLQVADAEETNAAVRRNHSIRATQHDLGNARTAVEDYTLRLNALAQTKADALAAVQFPVDGLGFDTTGVTYNGLPFSSASSAEQIRVSLGMAMAGAPAIRVIRVMDGSLLDAEGMAAVLEMARAHDFQVWVERVGNQDRDQGAVIIADGAVA